MRPGPDAVVFRKDKPFFRERPCTDLHGILHGIDSQPIVLPFLSLYLILLVVFTECGHNPKTAKQPSTFLDKLSNQLPAIYLESIIFVN